MNILKYSQFIIIETENFKFSLKPTFNTVLNKYFIRASVMSFSTQTINNERMGGKCTFPLFEYSFDSKELKGKEKKHEYLTNKYEEEFYNTALSYLEEYQNKIEILKAEINKRKESLADEEAEDFFSSL